MVTDVAWCGQYLTYELIQVPAASSLMQFPADLPAKEQKLVQVFFLCTYVQMKLLAQP